MTILKQQPSRRDFLIQGAAAVGSLTAAVPAVAQTTQVNTVEEAKANGDFSFSTSSGTVQGSPDRFEALEDALSWDRYDFYWSKYEPTQGEYCEEYLEDFGKQAAAYAAKGKHLLVDLDYTTPWAAERDGTFILGNQKFVRQSHPDGHTLLQTWVHGKGSTWDLKHEEKIDLSKLPITDEHRADWESYVRRTVTFLQKAPYNVKFFQIWNEAYPTSSFWYGDLDTYMQRVHLPAARIIHELGAKVVYGGWPCCGTLHEYTALLDKHKAWDSIDVLDVHYFPVSVFEYLRKECLKRGFDKSIWQTEVAFTKDINFVGNTYPRFVHWCLRNEPSKDKYKIFFFGMWAPDDVKAYGYQRMLYSGDSLSIHGRCLLALGKLLKGSSTQLFEDVVCEPPLKPELNENLSSIESFLIDGKRIVVAVHLIPGNTARIFLDSDGNSIHLDFGDPFVTLRFPTIELGTVAKAERSSMAGSIKDISKNLTAGPSERGVSISVPIRDEEVRDGKYIDMAEGEIHKTFYISMELTTYY
jgi:hypothetical protein